MLYSLVFVAVLLLIGLAVDYSYEVQIKYQLDLAADAAGIAATQAWALTMENGAAAVAAGTETFSKLETAADAAAVTAGTNAFHAQAGYLSGSATPSILPHDGTGTTVAAATTTVAVSYTTSVPTFFVRIAPISTSSVTVGGTSNAQIEISPYVNVYLILDTSASMTVASTPADMQKVVQWVAANPGSVFNPPTGGDTSPCGFACHDETNLTLADMALGRTRAHGVNATTRFDVMVYSLINDPTGAYNTYVSSYGEGLLPYIRDKYDSSQATANLSTFTFNLYGFNNDIGTAGDNSQLAVTNVSNANKATIASAINSQLTPGFNTHLNWTVLPKLALSSGIIGTGGNGATAATPIKFVILLTDGVTSDRDWEYGGGTGASTTIPQYNSNIAAFPTYRTGLCSQWNAVTQITIYGSTPGNPSAGNPVNECQVPSPATASCKTGTTAVCSSYTSKIWPVSPNGAFPAPTNNANGWTGDAWTGGTNTGIEAPIDTYFTKDANGQLTVAQSLGLCNTLKTTNNIILAIVETPYVPLNGQDPTYLPYEANLQQTIYPNGQNTTSAVSSALQSCATTGYYFQAASDTQIATGFEQLFDQFVGQYAHLTR